jgi:hypothetical protein
VVYESTNREGGASMARETELHHATETF